MKTHDVLAAMLVASTMLAGAAYAADQPAAVPATPQENAAQKAVDTDIRKLSADDAEAYRDMHQARVAIFDADPTQAKALVGKAQAALAKAKTDETVFTKAEADLKQPATAKATARPTDTKAIAWLPVDGPLPRGEDFVATPQKAAAVAAANKSFAKSDQKGALQTLKLADIDVNFTMAVLPLDKTVTNVDQTATLLDQGKYYEANAILKQTEDSLRFDMIDAVALPQKAAAATSAKTGQASGQATSGVTKPAAN